MIELTGFQRDLLYALAGMNRPNGIDIQETLEEYYGSQVVAARVYQNLDRLSDKGYVEKGEADSRTNYYELTERGESALENRRNWEENHLEVPIPEGPV